MHFKSLFPPLSHYHHALFIFLFIYFLHPFFFQIKKCLEISLLEKKYAKLQSYH